MALSNGRTPPTAAGMASSSSGTASVVGSARSTEPHMDQVSVIDCGPLRLVITGAPGNLTMEQYINDLLALQVRHVVRACESRYDTDALRRHGIEVHDLEFSDGSPPPDDVLSRWLDLVQDCFLANGLKPGERISVHCVAGLGRAPVLVAIALVEFCGLSGLEAVNFIRARRSRAMNARQAGFVEVYKPTRNKGGGCGPCTIM